MWRNATSLDDENIVSMCMALNADDPGPVPVYPQQVCRTLAILRKESHCGRVLVCEINGDPAGYVLLISFWSNELGGEVCNVDELFVAPVYRGRGLATDLFTMLTASEQSLWPTKPVAPVTRSLIGACPGRR